MMNTRQFLSAIVLLSISLLSCRAEQKIGEKINRKVQNSIHIDSLPITHYVTNDDFVFDVLEKYLTYSFFWENFNVFEKELRRNKHNSSIVDTVVIFSSGEDTAYFYNSSSQLILQRLVSNSSKVTFGDSIKVGSNIEVVKRAFDLGTIPDTLVVKDFENSSYFTFTFDSNKINQVTYNSWYFD